MGCCDAHRVWQLQLVAAVQSQQAVRDVAWSPYDPCHAAFMCKGGSLHTLQVSERPDATGRLHVQVHLVFISHELVLPCGLYQSNTNQACVQFHLVLMVTSLCCHVGSFTVTETKLVYSSI